MTKQIRYVAPSIGALEVAYVTDAIRNGWGEHCYDYLNRFEAAFAHLTQAQHAHATSSCTGAITLGLSALGIGSGDEVILADSNWIATVAPIVQLGAKPIFVDIDPTTWCIDPSKIESAITESTKAIIVTHLYGNIGPLDHLVRLCRKHNIDLIEDAAEAFGGRFDGRHVGTFGRFGVFSFHGTKTMTTGEGGVLITDDPELSERVKMLNNHGRSSDETRQFWPKTIGYKFRMSNVQAALGLAQVERATELVDDKRHTFERYWSSIQASTVLKKHIRLNPLSDARHEHAYWMTTAIIEHLPSINRDEIIAAFQNEKIDARVFFWPLSSLDFFKSAPTPQAHRCSRFGLNLPSPYGIETQDIQRVCDTLEKCIMTHSENVRDL